MARKGGKKKRTSIYDPEVADAASVASSAADSSVASGEDNAGGGKL